MSLNAKLRIGRSVPMVEQSEFMTDGEAALQLGVDGVAWRIARGILTRASLADGTQGVTRSSVEAELVWQRNAGHGRGFGEPWVACSGGSDWWRALSRPRRPYNS